MARFQLHEADKFALLAIENVYSALPAAHENQLSDGTWVLTRVPVEIQAHWQGWIGSIRFEKLQTANIVLLRSESSSNPEVFDQQHERLGNHLAEIFYVLQLSGVPEHVGADLLKGSFIHGTPNIRQVSELDHFKQTKGYTRVPVNMDRLHKAVRLRIALAGMQSSAPEFRRVIRGLNVLMDGLKQEHGQERIHQFVRSIEALILPEAGETKRQFVHRCQTFSRASPATRQALAEAGVTIR